MDGERWRDVWGDANYFPCDFCSGKVVGYVRVRLPDRSHGGYRATEYFMVCLTHMTLGEPVYPERVPFDFHRHLDAADEQERAEP